MLANFPDEFASFFGLPTGDQVGQATAEAVVPLVGQIPGLDIIGQIQQTIADIQAFITNLINTIYYIIGTIGGTIAGATLLVIIFYNVLWVMDLLGWFHDPQGIMAGLDAFRKTDFLGYLLRTGKELASAVEESGEGEYGFSLIFLAYPLVSYIYNMATTTTLPWLIGNVILFLLVPSWYVEAEVSELSDYETVYKPRAGLPALFATFISMGNFLTFNDAELNDEAEWGLSGNGMLFMLVNKVLTFFIGFVASIIIVPWNFISSIAFPVTLFIQTGLGNFNLNDVSFAYAKYDDESGKDVNVYNYGEQEY